MVYALAKIFDPTSVVREGEVVMANDTQGLADRLNGFVASIQGEGRLRPEARLGLLNEAQSRMQAFKGAFDQDRTFYGGILKKRGIDATDVIPDYGDLPAIDPSKFNTVRRDGGGKDDGKTPPTINKGPQPGAVTDGYRFKGGNPADPNSWEKVGA